MKIPRVLTDERDPKTLVEQVKLLTRATDGAIEFGSPQDPTDPTSTTRADGATHNGTLLNMAGSWFEVVLESVGVTTVTCTHNLNASTLAASTRPNVTWMCFGVVHDGTGSDATTTLSVDVWYQGGTRTADAIDLEFNLLAGGTVPTIGSSNPVVVRLYFQTGVR